MPDTKTGEKDKAQPLSQTDRPDADTALPAVQTEKSLANTSNRTDYSKEKQNMATIFNPNGFSVWMQTWLPIIFSGLVVVVIAIQAFIYNEQRKLMNEQRRIMNEQLMAMNNTLTETQSLASEAKTANDLTRKLVKSNLAAIVDFNRSMQYPDWEKRLQEVQFVNHGKVDGVDFEATVEIVRESIPDRKTIVRESFKLGGKGTSISNRNPFSRNLPLKGASPDDGKLVDDSKQGVIIRGELAYWDGFERVTSTFCYELLHLYYASVQRGNTYGWRPCEDVPLLLQAAVPRSQSVDK